MTRLVRKQLFSDPLIHGSGLQCFRFRRDIYVARKDLRPFFFIFLKLINRVMVVPHQQAIALSFETLSGPTVVSNGEVPGKIGSQGRRIVIYSGFFFRFSLSELP